MRALIDAAARRGTPADWLIRSKHNRKTITGEKLWERIAQSEALGEVEFTLPAAPDRPARAVRQTLYRTVVRSGPRRLDRDRKLTSGIF